MGATKVAIDGEWADAVLRLTFRVTSAECVKPQTALSVALDRPPLDEFLEMGTGPGGPGDIIKAAGHALFENLALHDNFSVSLEGTLASAAPNGRRIVVCIPGFAVDAHRYPWEIIFDGTRFIAGEAAVAINRTVPSRKGVARVAAVLGDELSIVSIIAADGTPGKPEWDAMRAALGRYKHGFRCKVLVTEPELMATILKDLPAGVSVEMVPANRTSLLRIIDEAEAHIVHLFCHGSSNHLMIANRLTELGEAPLLFSAFDLMPILTGAWVVMLNACESGASDKGTGATSIAAEFVASGVPVVTSMREIVPASTSNVVTEAFLSTALASLSKAVGTSDRFELDLDQAMVDARQSVAEASGGPQMLGQRKEWTLPIVYTAEAPLLIRVEDRARATGTTEILAEIALLKYNLRVGNWSLAEAALIEARIHERSAALTPEAMSSSASTAGGADI